MLEHTRNTTLHVTANGRSTSALTIGALWRNLAVPTKGIEGKQKRKVSLAFPHRAYTLKTGLCVCVCVCVRARTHTCAIKYTVYPFVPLGNTFVELVRMICRAGSLPEVIWWVTLWELVLRTNKLT